MASKSTSSYKSSGKSPGKVSNGTSEKSREEEINSIPLVDDDLTDDDWDERDLNPTLVPDVNAHQSTQSTVKTLSGPSVAFLNGLESPSTGPESLDTDLSPDEAEEKERLIVQVLELQNTLDDLSQRVDSVKEENLKLKSENQVLGQYIENLMTASSVFQSTSTSTPSKSSSRHHNRSSK